jgi:CII-binding regulator of phage lambda lysogenization HflD
MEIFGGFMVMMSILGFFLTVIWLVMPFVVFAIKGKVDKNEEMMARIENRLTAIEEQLTVLNQARQSSAAPAASIQEESPVSTQ